MKIWSIITLFEFIIFALMAILILVRKTDGAGVVQTMEIRWITLGILAVFFFIPFIIQIIWLIILKVNKK